MKKSSITFSKIVLLTGFYSFVELHAANLSNEALFYRCYAHLTRNRPADTDARLIQVRSGQLNYVDACMQVFDSAILDKISGELIVQNSESLKVLENFNQFHTSWFDDVNVFNALIPGGENINHFLHDGAEGALHLTRAVFHQEGKYSDAITARESLQAIRSKGYNTFSIWPTTQNRPDRWGSKDVKIWVGKPSSQVEANLSQVLDPTGTQNGLHIQMGKIIGIEPLKNLTLVDKLLYDANWARPTAMNPINITKSFGSGIIGTQPYIMINRIRSIGEVEDGGIKSSRVWSKQVFKEILCRDLPVVQPKDAIALVDSSGTNPFPFRNSSSCMQCHSSIDPMGWSIRDIRLNKTGNGHTTFLNSLYFLEKYPGTKLSQESGLVHGLGAATSADANFYKRPPKGHFYYRSYAGNLISKPYEGLDGEDGLGEVIAGLDDYYTCASKRYFEFFTGHKVTLEDITSPAAKKLNDKEVKLRNFTINLGKKLKENQKMRDVVKEIISSDYYKSSNYEIKY